MVLAHRRLVGDPSGSGARGSIRAMWLLALWLPHDANAKKPVPPEWSPGISAEDLVKAGNSAIAAKKPDEAIAAFTSALESQPDCGAALYGLGRSLVLAGRPADGVEPLARASTLFPDKPEPRIWHGRALGGAGRHEEAIAVAKAILAVKPASVDAQRIAQESLLARQEYAVAHQMLTDARAIANTVAYNCLDGLVYAAEGNTVKAAEMLPLCQGVPDAALYDALAAKVAAP